MTAEDVAAYLKLGINQVRTLMRTGTIPRLRFGNQYRVTRTALDLWLAQHQGEDISLDPMPQSVRSALTK